jgi:PKD repeat protein
MPSDLPSADGQSPATMDGLSKPVPVTLVAASAAPIPAAPAATGKKSGSVDPETLKVRKSKVLLILLGVTVYAAYAFWCMALLAMLPDPSGGKQQLVSLGLMSALGGVVVILGIGWFAFTRIAKSETSIALKRRSVIKAAAILLPAFCLSAAVPLMITRQPPLYIDIVSPTKAEDFVAPVAVTLSVQRAADTLKKLGQRPLKYQWDTNGDAKQDEETVQPSTTAVYQKQGVYGVIVRIVLSDGSVKRLTRQVIIPQSVFSVTPVQPIVEKPVNFSVAGLLPDPKTLVSVTWDFGDGTPQVTPKTPDTLHTFYTLGDYTVSAVILLQNNTQVSLHRTVSVQEQPPLPFPVTLTTQPQNLMGPAPFGALFRVDTTEPLKEVQWSFGDGKEERGADLLRIGHSFDNVGVYPVITRVRSMSGQLAELTTIVRVTETLSMSDLRFEGSPPVNNYIVTGEAPLDVEITPKTSVPLVHFLWELEGSGATVQGETVRGTFRKEGAYTLTLVGQDADGKTARIPITVQVKPPAAEATILVQPDGGVAPLKVSFDASQSFIPPDETVAGFKWLFGDEGGGTDQGQLGAARVEHTYQGPGDYTTTLQVVLASGKTYTATRTIVVRKPTLSACLETSRMKVQTGKGVEFDSGCSTGTPSSYLWDVRYDAQPNVVLAQSTTPKYVYVFDNAGTYTVSLTVKDQFGNEDSKSVTITVTP